MWSTQSGPGLLTLEWHSVLNHNQHEDLVLIIRAWRDDSVPAGFRARIVQVYPPTAGSGVMAVDVGQVSLIVSEWVQSWSSSNDAT